MKTGVKTTTHPVIGLQSPSDGESFLSKPSFSEWKNEKREPEVLRSIMKRAEDWEELYWHKDHVKRGWNSEKEGEEKSQKNAEKFSETTSPLPVIVKLINWLSIPELHPSNEGKQKSFLELERTYHRYTVLSPWRGFTLFSCAEWLQMKRRA